MSRASGYGGKRVAGFAVASQTQMEAGLSDSLIVTPGRLKFSPLIAKVLLFWQDTAGTPTINVSENVSSIDDDGVGIVGINFTTAFAGTGFQILGTAEQAASAGFLTCNTAFRSAADIQLETGAGASQALSDEDGSCACFGAQ